MEGKILALPCSQYYCQNNLDDSRYPIQSRLENTLLRVSFQGLITVFGYKHVLEGQSDLGMNLSFDISYKTVFSLRCDFLLGKKKMTTPTSTRNLEASAQP